MTGTQRQLADAALLGREGLGGCIVSRPRLAITTPATTWRDALLAAPTYPTGQAAGEALAAAGWAVFPVPRGRKFDSGPGAYTYANATTDPDEFTRMAERVKARHGVPDVNVATSPWRCLVPLVGIDLDGPGAVGAFLTEFPSASDWLRVRSSGKGGGLHVYVMGAEHPPTGANRWGGEVRAASGHLMLPGSVVDGHADYYRPEGRWLANVRATPALLKGTRKDRTDGPGVPVPEADLADLIARLSRTPPTSAARQRLGGYLDRLAQAQPGERHPAATSAVASAVAWSRRGGMPLRWALGQITQTYEEAAPDDRDHYGDVRTITRWALGREYA